MAEREDLIKELEELIPRFECLAEHRERSAGITVIKDTLEVHTRVMICLLKLYMPLYQLKEDGTIEAIN
jgi:cadmium resistance protein CadD (predicted permease)